jgi:hypothetical protein
MPMSSKVVSSLTDFRLKFCTFFSSSMHAIRPAQFILLHLIVLTISGKEKAYRWWSTSLCNFLQSPVTSSKVQIFSSAPWSHTFPIDVLPLMYDGNTWTKITLSPQLVMEANTSHTKFHRNTLSDVGDTWTQLHTWDRFHSPRAKKHKISNRSTSDFHGNKQL